MEPDDTTPAERHAARAALYGLLAGAFHYPDDRTVRELTADEAVDGVRQAAATLGFEAEVEALVDALAGTAPADLRVAYNDLFGVPGDDGTYPVVPYEAHYTTRDEVSEEQRRIAQVVGLYDEFGLDVAESFGERQDHVAAELELAQVMAAQRAVAADRGEDEAAARIERAEATTLSRHLADFVPTLAHEVRGATDGGVYAAAADLAEALVARDNGRHPDVDPDVDAPRGGETA